MPEGPELHLAAQFVRSIGHRYLFSGAVVKSEVSLKNPDVLWKKPEYRVDAVSRGKEMKVLLNDVESSSSILFRFGMSGKFEWTKKDDLPKRAHLRFFSKEDDMVLSFVDYRRFGRWSVDEDWSRDRGPCVVTEPQLFRQNVLDNLDDKAFDKPLCEVMLNQKYFNGVGNYLRAEVLFRLRFRPFEKARTILAPLAEAKAEYGKVTTERKEKSNDKTGRTKDVKDETHRVSGGRKLKLKKVKIEANSGDSENKSKAEVVKPAIETSAGIKKELDVETKDLKLNVAPTNDSSPDILELTSQLANEVVGLGFDGGYFSEARDKWESGFGQWLRCYFKEDMNSVKDHNGRTMWFQGEAGPMAPTGVKRGTREKNKKGDEEGSPKKKTKKVKDDDAKTDEGEKKKQIRKVREDNKKNVANSDVRSLSRS